MKKILTIFALACLIYLTSANDKEIWPGPEGGNSSTTSVPPITTTPTTTSKPTTSSTTTKPTTTTTTTTRTTTTTKPTTTTSKPITTSIKPTPSPRPLNPVGKWAANYTNSNYTCLVLAGALDIDVYYKVGNATKNMTIHVPPDAKAFGQCGNKDSTTESIFLNWTHLNSISFNFKKNTDNQKYDLQSVIAMLYMQLPGDNDTTLFVLQHIQSEFSTPLSNSYKCVQQQSLNLTAKNCNGTLRISHFQMQAFRNSSNLNFDDALDCLTSGTPDVVPIAVGCALAALIVIVLAAYLIGRRRSQARGYLSMFAQNKREEDYIPMKNLSCFN